MILMYVICGIISR